MRSNGSRLAAALGHSRRPKGKRQGARRGAASPLVLIGVGLAVVVVVWLLFTSCLWNPARCGEVAGRDAAAWYEENLVDVPRSPAALSGDSIDVYLDFSNGMGEGMKASQAMNLQLTNFLVGRRHRAYRVGATKQPTRIDLRAQSSELLVLRNFSDNASYLRSPLDSVQLHPERTFLYVTDFENILDARREVVGAPRAHAIDIEAWGQGAFKYWLSQGNRLDIFAFPYDKPGLWLGNTVQRNHIYYIVFTPKAELVDPKAFRASLLVYLEDKFQQASGTGVRFTYWADDIIKGGTQAPPQCGANANLMVLDCGQLTGSRGADWYQVPVSSLADLQNNEGIQDKRVLTLSLQQRIGFLEGAEFGLRVYDVTQRLQGVQQYLTRAAEEAATPVEVNTETGEQVSQPVSVPTTSTLPEEQPAPGVFTIVHNPDTHEIGIKLDPNFAGVTESTVYRIDIVLEAGRLADQQAADDVLVLNYGGGYQIRALGESIKMALRDIVTELADRSLHSVYIRIDP